MSKEISVFDFNGNKVRVTELKGEVWFIFKDVCDYLGIRPIDASRFLDIDETSKSADMHLRIPKVNRGMILVNESGFYKTVFRSNHPEAKKFTSWVTKEVLPAIRKTGGYISPFAEQSAESFNKMAEVSKDLYEKNSILREDLIRKTKENRDLAKTNEELNLVLEREVTKEDFKHLEDCVYKLEKDIKSLLKNTRPSKIVRAELNDLVRRYALKNNIQDNEAWVKLYKAITSKYHVSVYDNTKKKTSIELITEYGMLPEAVEIMEDMMKEDIVEINLFDDYDIALEDV